jgi:hypothetical protein
MLSWDCACAPMAVSAIAMDRTDFFILAVSIIFTQSARMAPF